MNLLESVIEIARRPTGDLAYTARQLAQLSLFDWLVCGRAGAAEPVSGKVRALAQEEAGRGVASMFGGGSAPARMAALVNGTTSHALDYDDTHFAHIGHLSVGLYPAALAVGEEVDASAQSMTDAFLVGAEAAIRIGQTLGGAHYDRGFHQTATAGAFGATIAACRLYGLSGEAVRAAIGLCSTRASGLKSQFGTMGKPYNAGMAAANGVECAKLAKLGLSSSVDGLLGTQGFVDTHSDATGEPTPEKISAFDDIKYKFHACCHGTHAMIEALAPVRSANELRLEQVKGVRLRTHPRWLRVCDNPAPRTGLEVKFSYRWLAGLTLDGRETASDKLYTDELADDDRYRTFATRVHVVGDETLSDMQAAGEIELEEGRSLAFEHDLASRQPVQLLEQRLRAKAAATLGADMSELEPTLGALDALSARDIGRMAQGAM